MKKSGFGIIGLVLVAAVYYFTAGSAQVTEKIKVQVNNELTTLQQNGFGVTQREIKETEEHFVISFDDPAKITNYLNVQNAQVKQEDILLFKGFAIGVDAKYLNDRYSALSLDIYPVKLPQSILESTNKKDKITVKHINTMMSEKRLLVHLDINKLLSGFKGYIKDIHETFEEEEKITFISQGLKFEGDIEDNKIKALQHRLKLLSLDTGKELTMKLSNLTFNFALTGSSPYDSDLGYTIEKIDIQGEPKFSMLIKNLNFNAQNSADNDLVKSSIVTKTDEIEISENQKIYKISKILFDFKLDNLDIAALEALQHIDINDTKATNALSQKILAKGITVSIPKFSVKQLEQNGTAMDGFTLSSSLGIDKSFDLGASSKNPLAALNALIVKTNISVSTDLFALIAQEPKAIMLLMLMPPVEKEGNKIYEIEFIKGKLTVNGIPMI